MKLFCSFCGKSSDEVGRLVAGPNMFILCNKCHAGAAAPSPAPEPYDRFAWRFAFRKLIGGRDGKPLAMQFRSAPVVDWYKQIPLEACYALEELLDARSPVNPLARPKLPPPDMIEMVDGKPTRLKASIELERAQEAAAIHRRRLVEKAKKSGEKLGEDGASILAFASEKNDQSDRTQRLSRSVSSDWSAPQYQTIERF